MICLKIKYKKIKLLKIHQETINKIFYDKNVCCIYNEIKKSNDQLK